VTSFTIGHSNSQATVFTHLAELLLTDDSVPSDRFRIAGSTFDRSQQPDRNRKTRSLGSARLVLARLSSLTASHSPLTTTLTQTNVVVARPPAYLPARPPAGMLNCSTTSSQLHITTLLLSTSLTNGPTSPPTYHPNVSSLMTTSLQPLSTTLVYPTSTTRQRDTSLRHTTPYFPTQHFTTLHYTENSRSSRGPPKRLVNTCLSKLTSTSDCVPQSSFGCQSLSIEQRSFVTALCVVL
jgi:hypothetical protein